MSIEEIASLITRRIGLDPGSVGPDTIAGAIRRRMADSNAADASAYLQDLQASDEEWQKLVDEVVVPETWFFRDWEPFAYLAQYVISEWLPSHPNQTLHILSVPCAAGQEAYSIAMALMDAGVRRKRFQIEAIDISRAALEKSQRGLYGRGSFRGERLGFRDRYFEEMDGEFAVAPEVKASVSFAQGNLLDKAFPINRGPYDIIFCRNLLIYFDSASTHQAVRVLDRLLGKGGVLFAGHAETTHVLGPKFVRINHPRSFAYRKAKHGAQPAPARAGSPPLQSRPRKSPTKWPVGRSKKRKTHTRDTAASVSRREEFDSHPSIDGDQALLDRANHLANEGTLEEAKELCEKVIHTTGGSAECYCLLGLVHQAANDEASAEDSFNKALYLDPDNYEALIHLMLMLEHRGETGKAEALRRRVERVQKRSAGRSA